jgi:hypothetical protein
VPESQSGRFGKEKSVLILPGIEFLTVHPVGLVRVGSVCNDGHLVVH